MKIPPVGGTGLQADNTHSMQFKNKNSFESFLQSFEMFPLSVSASNQTCVAYFSIVRIILPFPDILEPNI
jgi:hypothetical protein